MFQGVAARVTQVSRLGGVFLQWNIFFGDFKFIRVQIGCEGPSDAGGVIMGSG